MGAATSCGLHAAPCGIKSADPKYIVCDVKGACTDYQNDQARCVFRDDAELLEPVWHGALTSCEPMESLQLNFVAMGAVGLDWRVSALPAPEGFLLYGGSAVVIERREGPPPASPASGPGAADVAAEGACAGDRLEHAVLGAPRRVLLAFPRWAVDLQRAKWLAASTHPGHTRLLCRLRRVLCTGPFGQVVFEFDYPEGAALKDWRCEHGQMPEPAARALCQDLLETVARLQPTPLRLWGLLDASAAYLDGEGVLVALLPLGCLLSSAGARGAALAAVLRGRDTASLAPELRLPGGSSDHGAGEEQPVGGAADAFAAAALVLEALCGRGPEAAREPAVLGALPAGADDLLRRLLHDEPAWRLGCEDALLHPWLASRMPSWTKTSAIGGS